MLDKQFCPHEEFCSVLSLPFLYIADVDIDAVLV